MNESTTWGDWPLAIDPSTDYNAAPGGLSIGPPGCQTVQGNGDDGSKRRAACDECRKRKLKCSGDPVGCMRCVKQSLMCHYSHQKQMGRPRKRQKISDTDEEFTRIGEDAHGQPNLRLSSPGAPDQSFRGKDRYAVPCPVVGAQFVKTHQVPPRTRFLPDDAHYSSQHAQDNSHDSDSTPPNDSPPTPYLSYPTSMEQWPDYSTMTQLPQMVADNHKTPSDTRGIAFESLNSLPTVPACPCLPNLYLTLSTLATISTFPISNHTVESLLTATRTAHSVCYCTICPKSFQTGIQNVMLLGTLLTVLADGWNRVRIASATELRKGFSAIRLPTTDLEPELTPQEALCWRLFAHVLVRAHVFGDAMTPNLFKLPDGSLSTSSCPFLCPKGEPVTLSFLVNAMERRQQTWHDMQDPTGEFPARTEFTDLQLRVRASNHVMAGTQGTHNHDMEEEGHLCLKIVSGARMVVKTLDQPAPTCADVLNGHVHRDECHICDGAVGSQYLRGTTASDTLT